MPVYRHELQEGDCFRYYHATTPRVVWNASQDPDLENPAPELPTTSSAEWRYSSECTANMESRVIRLEHFSTHPEPTEIECYDDWSGYPCDKPWRYVRGKGWIR